MYNMCQNSKDKIAEYIINSIDYMLLDQQKEVLTDNGRKRWIINTNYLKVRDEQKIKENFSGILSAMQETYFTIRANKLIDQII